MDIVKRMLPSALWTLLVAGGFVYLLFWPAPRPPDNLKVTRDLAVNSLLLSGDLTVAGYSGRYVAKPGGLHPQDKDTVRQSDLSDKPTILNPDEIQLSVSVPWELIVAGLNAGTSKILCRKGSPPLGAVTVRYVSCDRAGLGGKCFAMVQIPLDKAADLATQLKTQPAGFQLDDNSCK
jgi:hypothetical protein